jgi:hypothetical protein
MGKYKNYRYHPIWDERIFDQIAADADPVLIERHNMDVCRKRRETFREMTDLRNKPRRTIPEEIRLKELEDKWKKLKLCGGTK